MNVLDAAQLAGSLDAGQAFFTVHYASESFLDVQDRPMEIAAIAIYDLAENVTSTFSRVDAPDGIDPEMFLLDRFYEFLSANRDATFLHWNMGSAEFGFEPIAKRFFYLRKEAPPVAAPRERVDVDKLIRSRFGSEYAPHPRLASIARLNNLDMRGFMSGADEAASFKTASWNDVSRSSATKAKLISDLFRRIVTGNLRSNNSAGRLKFAGGEVDAVSVVLAIGERFLLVQRNLGRRGQKRPALEFKDEYDDQFLMQALLSQYFEDVVAEDYLPAHAGGKSRVDFLLRDFGLAVELKHTRDGLDARKLGEELIVDSARYKAGTSANHMIALVFDHDGRIVNPRGIERDLQREVGGADLAVTVKIFDR